MKNSATINNVSHPFEPIYNQESEILILGSFPSVKSREEHFYYGNIHNRFWKVLAAVFSCSVPTNVEQKKEFLLSHHIALWDILKSCDISRSADSSIKNTRPNDIFKVISHSRVNKIVLNGKTALKYFEKYFKPDTTIQVICLPSTSPANAAWSLEKLIDAWSVIL